MRIEDKREKEIENIVGLYRGQYEQSKRDIFKFVEQLKFKIEIQLVPKITVKSSEESLDAVVQKDKYDNFQIFINREQHDKIERLRFTIAHEIAHICLGHFDDLQQGVLFRDTLNVVNSGESTKEAEANIFAAELLMPKKEILILMKEYPQENDRLINMVSVIYNVSRTASKFRIMNLRGNNA